jgi:hypothetical protein
MLLGTASFASWSVAKVVMSKMAGCRRRQQWRAAHSRQGSTDAGNAPGMTTSPAAVRHRVLG